MCLTCAECPLLELESQQGLTGLITQAFCALEGPRGMWLPISSVLPIEECLDGLKNTVCHRNHRRVRDQIRMEVARGARALAKIEECLEKDEVMKSEGGALSEDPVSQPA